MGLMIPTSKSKMKKILIPEYLTGAGKWVYNGYTAAWVSKGYQVISRKTLGVEDPPENCSIMIACHNILAKNVKELNEKIRWLSKFEKVYLFVTANRFPDPWGSHVNYVSTFAADSDFVEILKNRLNNIHFWSFCNTSKKPEFWSDWDVVHYLPLAFDSINYRRAYDEKYASDVCFVGGWADNGFNTKKQILKDWLGAFKDTDLKCRFLINQNVSHEEEEKILSSTKVCINIHDDYQHELGLDTNERTFKSLGLNGCLVSDYVAELESLDLGIRLTRSPVSMSIVAQTPCSEEAKENNRKNILENHTYVCRVEEMLSWG